MIYCRTALFAAACLILTCVRLVPAHGETEFEAARRKAATMNPLGVSATLTLPGGRTQFHRGEMIPLAAAFASRLPGKYDLNTDTGSRDLEWNSDTFHVDHSTGAVDPLPVYYDREFGMAYSGPGPRFEPLAAKPLTISYTLNEWLRFDAPGHYRVYLTSERITDAAKRHNDLFFQGHAATSSAVEFDVLPDDPAWDAQTLQATLPLYNAQGYNSRTDASQQAAIRTVRFLDTPDAARAMVARYGTFSDFDFANTRTYNQTQLGLFGFPQPSFVISEMERQISDPDFPISEQFIYDLAQVQFLAAYTQPIPRYVPGDPTKEKQRQDLLRQRLAAMTALQEQDWERLKAAAPNKRGKARVASLYALLMLDYHHQNTAEYQDRVRALVPVFDDLTPEQQDNLLGYNWDNLRGPDMLPVLRRLYAKPVADVGVGNSREAESLDQHSLALRRFVELSPAEGRALLLTEIKSTRPRVDLPTLCSLPDRRLPSLDNILAANLESVLHTGSGDSEDVSRLVERYATAAILPRVKAAYGDKGGRCACDFQANLLAYFLRTDPVFGAAQMRKALATRKDTGCYRFVLSDVAALQTGPDLEHLAVRHLHDPDTEVAADAAKMLGENGSPRDEPALWARLREWHTHWAGKADLIEPTDLRVSSMESELEFRLVDALAVSPKWLTTQTQLQALDKLCVTTGAHQNIQTCLQAWTPPTDPISIIYGGEADDWIVVQYKSLPSFAALEDKLAQFPRGTQLRLSRTNFPDAASQAQAFARLKPFLKSHGTLLTLEPFSHPQLP